MDKGKRGERECPSPTRADRETDHTTQSLKIGRIYVCSTAMWPNNNSSSNNHRLTHSHSSLFSFFFVLTFRDLCLQCFDAVGWVAGRA